jgi:hypothetical protein
MRSSDEDHLFTFNHAWAGYQEEIAGFSVSEPGDIYSTF